MSYDTESAIDAVLFLGNLESSNLIAETDHTSIPNLELQVDNKSGYQFSPILVMIRAASFSKMEQNILKVILS